MQMDFAQNYALPTEIISACSDIHVEKKASHFFFGSILIHSHLYVYTSIRGWLYRKITVVLFFRKQHNGQKSLKKRALISHCRR